MRHDDFGFDEFDLEDEKEQDEFKLKKRVGRIKLPPLKVDKTPAIQKKKKGKKRRNR